MKKDRQFSIRISEQDLETIRRKAAQAHMSQSDYVTACCLGKRIVILDGLREVLRQQKAIGNNLNQLTVLANMGKVFDRFWVFVLDRSIWSQGIDWWYWIVLNRCGCCVC